MVVLNAGVVVGSEGFGFDQDGEEHKKIPHIGLLWLRMVLKLEPTPVSIVLALKRQE